MPGSIIFHEVYEHLIDTKGVDEQVIQVQQGWPAPASLALEVAWGITDPKWNDHEKLQPHSQGEHCLHLPVEVSAAYQ